MGLSPGAENRAIWNSGVATPTMSLPAGNDIVADKDWSELESCSSDPRARRSLAVPAPRHDWCLSTELQGAYGDELMDATIDRDGWR